MLPEKIQQLVLTKKALDELALDIEQGQYPAAMLEEFKESVDHARTTIWTLLKLEEEKHAAETGYVFDLQRKLVEYRLRRAQRLLHQIEADINAMEIEINTPGITEFHGTLKAVDERLLRMLQTGR